APGEAVGEGLGRVVLAPAGGPPRPEGDVAVPAAGHGPGAVLLHLVEALGWDVGVGVVAVGEAGEDLELRRGEAGGVEVEGDPPVLHGPGQGGAARPVAVAVAVVAGRGGGAVAGVVGEDDGVLVEGRLGDVVL